MPVARPPSPFVPRPAPTRTCFPWDYDKRSIGRNIIFHYEHISIIFNPFAGGLRGRKIERLACAETILRQYARKVTKLSTTAPRTAGEIARACVQSGSDLIMAAGGDGTINEIVEGMAGTQIPLGVLPAGTANVLANEVGLSSGMEKAARRVPECLKQRVPLGRLDFTGGSSQHFLLMAGAGLDAHVVFHLNQALKARMGKLAYYLSGFGQFGRTLEEFQVVANGKNHDCSFALISKVRNYGGDLEIARDVSLLDDRFEVVLFRGSNSFRYFLYLSGVAMRFHRQIAGVKTYRASELSLVPRNGDLVHLQVDGEIAGRLPATVTMVPDSLTLLIPPGYPRRR